MRLLYCIMIISHFYCSAYSQPTPVDVSEGKASIILLLLGNAIEAPMVFKQPPTIILPVAFSAGLGYRINHQLDLYGVYNVNLITRVLAKESKYFTQGRYNEFGLESRYFFYSGIYALGGLYASKMSTDEIEEYMNSTHTYELRYPAVSKTIASFSLGVGHAGSVGFLELRIHSGITTFEIANDLKGSLLTYSLRYGLNIPFQIR